MMLGGFDVLDAYRADLAQAQVSSFGACDGTWLMLGTILQRAAAMPPVERSAYLANALLPAVAASESCASHANAGGLTSESRPAAPTLLDLVRQMAACAEDHGAFAVSMVLLDHARALIEPADVGVQGRLIYQQARVLKKVGELERSDQLLGDLLEMARTAQDRNLVAWAHVGVGANARIRGNYPQAREAFKAALECAAPGPEGAEIQSHAHHGLLIGCVMAGDFGAALVHGVEALKLTENAARRVELLANIAAACYESGDYRSALVGYLRVLADRPSIRVYINALGGAALSASRISDARAVRELGSRAQELLGRDNPAHELADMARECAEAYRAIGDAGRYEWFRHEAISRAKRGAFFEVLHRIEQQDAVHTTLSVTPKTPALSPEARSAVEEFALGDSEELLAVAVSSAPLDS
jgi:tetratricopeptide (TPR) repeat protein